MKKCESVFGNWWWPSLPGNKSSQEISFVKIIEFFSRPPFKDPVFLEQKYVIEGLHPKEIATQTFSSRQSVIKYLRKYGIPLRAEDQLPNGPPPFGLKLARYRAIIDKREQASIQKMEKLRSEGLSYEKIADVLNSMGVFTRSKKSKWYAKTVRDVLLRTKNPDPNNPGAVRSREKKPALPNNSDAVHESYRHINDSASTAPSPSPQSTSENLKVCSACGKAQGQDHFYKKGDRWDTRCKSCVLLAKARSYRQKNGSAFEWKLKCLGR